MTEVYNLSVRLTDHDAPSIIETAQPNVASEIATYISEATPIRTKEDYLRFIGGITAIINAHSNELSVPNPLFEKEMKLLGRFEHGFKTPWGGVAFKHVDDNAQTFEKLLIVQQARNASGVLGLEYHHVKDEYLNILEGYAILISSPEEQWEKGEVTLEFAGPGMKAALHPGNRHGIIAVTNLVVQENANSTEIEDIIMVWDGPLKSQ